MRHTKISACIIMTLCAITICLIIVIGIYHKNVEDNTVIYNSQNEIRTESPEFYNTKPISDAYLSEDTTSLSEKDKIIYDKSIEIIGNIISKDMSNYEKELAIHDYIVKYTTYDLDSLNIFKKSSENSDNPYGALINGKAICTGYASTFKMFMDMFEIPNIIIFAKDSEDDDHAWNMVQLDNEWYYVDVTWDDPTPDEKDRPALHKYFNVTEEFLADNEHIWDKSKLPKAASTKYSYEKITGKSEEELEYEIQTMY